MKYIKTFEKIIKNTDPRVLNHKLLIFSNKLKEIANKIKELDKLENSYVSMFFMDSHDISIIYKGKQPDVLGNIDLLVIRLINWDSDAGDYILKIEFPEYIREYNSIAGKIFFNYMKDKYKPNLFGRNLSFKFNIADQDKMITDLEECEEYVEIKMYANKYNI